MIDEKYLTTAFLAGMEWERSKNKLPIKEAIAVCVTRIKEKSAQHRVQRTGDHVCPMCGLPCGDKPMHIVCDPAIR